MTSASARSKPLLSSAAAAASTIALPIPPRRIEAEDAEAEGNRERHCDLPHQSVSSPETNQVLLETNQAIKVEPYSVSVTPPSTNLTPKSMSPTNPNEKNHNSEIPTGSPPLVRVTSNKTFMNIPKTTISLDDSRKCHLCGWSFNSPENEREHMRRHGQSDFVCQTCHRAFVDKSQLEVHTRSHISEKPYKCTLCDREFSRSGNLATHLRTHTQTKPFECGFCHKKFSQRVNMELHTRTHTGVRPYACGVCNRTFTSCSNMRRHWRQVHPSIPEPKLGTTQLKNGMPEKQFYSDPILSKTFTRPQVSPDSCPKTRNNSSESIGPLIQSLRKKLAKDEGDHRLVTDCDVKKERIELSQPQDSRENTDWKSVAAERLKLNQNQTFCPTSVDGRLAKQPQDLNDSRENLLTKTDTKWPFATRNVLVGLTNSETYCSTPSKEGGIFGLLLGETFTQVNLPQKAPSDLDDSSFESDGGLSDTENVLALPSSRSPLKMSPSSVSPKVVSATRPSGNSPPKETNRFPRASINQPELIDHSEIEDHSAIEGSSETSESAKLLAADSGPDAKSQPDSLTEGINGDKVFMEVNSMPYQLRLELRQREHAEEEKRKREKRDQMPARRSRILHRYAMLNAASNIYAETSTPVFGFAKIAQEADMKAASPPLSSTDATPTAYQVTIPRSLKFTPPIVGGPAGSKRKRSHTNALPNNAASGVLARNSVIPGLVFPNPPSINPTILHPVGVNPADLGSNPERGTQPTPVTSLPPPSPAGDPNSAPNSSSSEPLVGSYNGYNTATINSAAPGTLRVNHTENNAQTRATDSNSNSWATAMLAHQSYPYSVNRAENQNWPGFNNPFGQDLVFSQLQYLYGYNPQLALAQWAQLQAYQATMPTVSLGSTVSAFGYAPSPTTVPTAYSPATMMYDPNSTHASMFSHSVNPPLPRAAAVTIEDIITQGRARDSQMKSTGLTPTVPLTSEKSSRLSFSIPHQKRLVASPPSEVCKQELDELERLGLDPEKSTEHVFPEGLPPVFVDEKSATKIHLGDADSLLARLKVGCQTTEPAKDQDAVDVTNSPPKPKSPFSSPEKKKKLPKESNRHPSETCLTPPPTAGSALTTSLLASAPPTVDKTEKLNSSTTSHIPPVVVPARLRDKTG